MIGVVYCIAVFFAVQNFCKDQWLCIAGIIHEFIFRAATHTGKIGRFEFRMRTVKRCYA